MQSYQVTYRVTVGKQRVITRDRNGNVSIVESGGTIVTKTAYVFANSPSDAAQKAQAQENFGKINYDFQLVSVQQFNACGIADPARQNIYLTVPGQVFNPQSLTVPITDQTIGGGGPTPKPPVKQ